jgi:hypothetical protein
MGACQAPSAPEVPISQSNAIVPYRPAFALRQQPGLPFADYLPVRLIRQAAHGVGYSFRERIWTPAVTLWTFLSQVLRQSS